MTLSTDNVNYYFWKISLASISQYCNQKKNTTDDVADAEEKVHDEVKRLAEDRDTWRQTTHQPSDEDGTW